MRFTPIVVLGLTAPAFANTVTFYSSRAAWEAVTIDRVVLATFSEPVWPVNQVLTGDWTLNGVTYRGKGGTPQPNIYVINPSPLNGPALTANGDEDIDIILANPVRSFGFDVQVNQFGSVFVRAFDASDREMGFLELPASTSGFFGITAVGGVSRVNFKSVNGAIANSLLDDVTGASVVCPADLNADNLVDDADFSIFVVSYNSLLCNDPLVAPGCPGDLDLDGLTNDADFSLFARAYDELLCP
ncbi:MAG TPA: hypothetical protein VF777_09155 [Phycisphaerales bacterium]